VFGVRTRRERSWIWSLSPPPGLPSGPGAPTCRGAGNRSHPSVGRSMPREAGGGPRAGCAKAAQGASGLTVLEPLPYNGEVRETRYAKEDLPTTSSTQAARARLPISHAHAGRPDGAQATAAERTLPPHRVGRAGHPGMRKERRLRRRADFALVHKKGRSWSHPLLVLRALHNQRETTRFGFIVSRRVGTAVARNRVKRRLREICRREPVRPGWDLVLIARAQIAQAPFPELQRAVQELLRRGRLSEDAPSGAGRRGHDR